MNNIYFTSDTHWAHKNIITYSNRPFTSVTEMDEALIKNWNNVVKSNDEIYHLGDFTFSKDHKYITNILKRLNGKIHLIWGNHDEDMKRVIYNNRTLVTSTDYYKEIKINKQLICLFHYGQRVWNRSHHGSIHLYGHSHGTLPPYGKSVDVGVDAKFLTEEYRPISIDEVFEYMKTREPEGMIKSEDRISNGEMWAGE
jgi:calcineurin-like phosphoesterase family protein